MQSQPGTKGLDSMGIPAGQDCCFGVQLFQMSELQAWITNET